MKRKELTALLLEVARQAGYAAHTGFDYDASHTIRSYPAAWLDPLRLDAIRGRRQGTRTYAVTLRLLDIDPRQGTDARERVWERLEEDMARIARTLASHPETCGAGALRCTADEYSLTAHGELSLCGSFTVDLPFCEQI